MVTFVILNYKNMKDTIECIHSIKELNTSKKISIVVVDNHSECPQDMKKIKPLCDKLIELNENVGFAKGNNVGANYAIDKYHPDFLVVINNDTIIEEKDFIEKIYALEKETRFDVLGPKILTKGGESVNPFKAYQTIEEVDEELSKSKKLIKIYQSKVLRTLLKAYFRLKYLLIKPYHQENGAKRQFGVALHGCALIFSKKYYQKHNDVFYNETFMYHEEEFLEYRRRKENLIFVYDPDITIFHKEGATLNKRFQDNYEKLIFKEKERMSSLSKLRKVLEENKEI